MYGELARRLDKQWSTYGDEALDRFAKELTEILCTPRKLQHLHRLLVDFTLPDDDTDGMVKLCASKNNAPTDSPAIALKIECGCIELSDGTQICDEDDLAGTVSAGDISFTGIPGYNPNGTQVPMLVNGVMQMVNVNSTACGTGGSFSALNSGGETSISEPPPEETVTGSASGGDAPHLP